MKNWHQSSNSYFLRDKSNQLELLPKAVYLVKESPMTGLYLDKMSDEFTFNHKVYGKDDKFVQRCLKTYQETTTNLGVLLSGTKGTGKSVTAKQLCNILDLPIIMIDEEFDNLDVFISEIEQPCIILIDEYEKVFQKSHMLLSVMDGVSMSSYRRVFVLSTNENYINENLLNRPSRIRYVKKYGNLEVDVVYEIMNDILKYPEYQEDLIETLKSFDIVTIDLVISIINEINIHNQPASEFADIFNAEYTDKKYDVFTEDGTKIHSYVSLHKNRDIAANSTKFIGGSVYVYDNNGDDIYMGEYEGFKDGFWIIREKKYIFKPALNPTFAYAG